MLEEASIKCRNTARNRPEGETTGRFLYGLKYESYNLYKVVSSLKPHTIHKELTYDIL